MEIHPATESGCPDIKDPSKPDGFGSILFPGGTGKENKHREKLKTSEQHQKRQHRFSENTVMRKIEHRSDFAEAGAYVADAGEGCGKVCENIKFAVQGNKKGTDKDKRNIHDGKASRPSDSRHADIVL